jgi:hypothetical protein
MMRREVERIRRIRKEEGEEAYNRARHGYIGRYIGAIGVTLTAVAVGSVAPPVGIGIVAVVGALKGAWDGANDETGLDNAKTAAKTAMRVAHVWRH